MRRGNDTVADASGRGAWWETAVGYEVYLRSFADADGDGTGDLPGLIDRLGHLDALGVDAVWITPFMPSPGADHGYDVADYCDLDPQFGTLADFDRLVAEAHALGIRILVDIVPNHSSSQHPWFVDAISSPESDKRDWYLWRDPAPDGGPPNNWVSYFGGPAWTLDPASGQYYCHLFLPEQPDLNWRNPEVRSAFDDILRFWLDRGADGFRIDVAHSLLKDRDLRDNPQIAEIPPGPDPMNAFLSFEHRHDMDQDDNPEIFRRWNTIAAEYDALLLGEIALDDFDRVRRYTDGEALHRVFALRTTWIGWNPEYVAQSVRDLAATVGPGVAWAFSCHDQPRPVTRFGGGPRGAARAMLLTTLSLALDGMPFLYQGQELGIGDGEPLTGIREDPIAVRNEGAVGRDGCRTPMPWSDGPQNGFTTAAHAWLPARIRPLTETVEGQRSEKDSWLGRHRELLALWRRVRGSADAPAELLATDDDLVIVARRGRIMAVANLSERQAEVPLPQAHWSVLFSSRGGSQDGAVEGAVVVPAETALLLRG